MFRDGLRSAVPSDLDEGEPGAASNAIEVEESPPISSPAEGAPGAFTKQKRSRGKSRSRQRGRDELVPTNQPSELADDADIVNDLTEQVGGQFVPHSSSRRTPRILPPPRLTPEAAAEIEARRSAVHKARDLAESGYISEAFHLLCPNWVTHSATACVAADLALRSADAALMGLAREAICRPQLESTGAIVARRIGLAIALNEPDKKLFADLHLVTPSNFDAVVIGIVKMISQSPSQETAFWRDSIRRVLAYDEASVRQIRITWPILAASRLLAIYRFWREADPGRYLTLNEIVKEVLPTGIWELSVPRIEGYLYSFAGHRVGESPPILPYQILSLAAVLESQDRLPDSLRAQVTDAVAIQIKDLEPDYLERFIAWGEFSSIARLALVKGAPEEAPDLLGMSGHLRVPTPVERLHSAEVAAHRSASRSGASQTVDPRVLEAIRQRVMSSDAPVVSASAAHAALRVDPTLARTGWCGTERFGRFVLEYLPELSYVASPPPGWIYDPARHGEDDLPQQIKPTTGSGIFDVDAAG